MITFNGNLSSVLILTEVLGFKVYGSIDFDLHLIIVTCQNTCTCISTCIDAKLSWRLSRQNCRYIIIDAKLSLYYWWSWVSNRKFTFCNAKTASFRNLTDNLKHLFNLWSFTADISRLLISIVCWHQLFYVRHDQTFKKQVNSLHNTNLSRSCSWLFWKVGHQFCCTFPIDLSMSETRDPP
jgi:hypothetical protein